VLPRSARTEEKNMNKKSHLNYRSIPTLFIGLMICMLCFSGAASAQNTGRQASGGTIDPGTTVQVRTNESINTSNADGRVFSGVVAEDVRDRAGNIAIPKGSDVELVVKRTSNDELALDLDAVTVNGQRYGIETQETMNTDRREGIGKNKRTGEYVGGGAILGAIIGGIAGGGKGAAIGAGAGAAAGAGAQVLTRGKNIEVPAESLLSFQLEQPMRSPALDRGFYRDGQHYHSGYGNDTASDAYRAGLQAGRADAERNLPRSAQSTRWNTDPQRRDYEAGYMRGYEDARRQ